MGTLRHLMLTPALDTRIIHDTAEPGATIRMNAARISQWAIPFDGFAELLADQGYFDTADEARVALDQFAADDDRKDACCRALGDVMLDALIPARRKKGRRAKGAPLRSMALRYIQKWYPLVLQFEAAVEECRSRQPDLTNDELWTQLTTDQVYAFKYSPSAPRVTAADFPKLTPDHAALMERLATALEKAPAIQYARISKYQQQLFGVLVGKKGEAKRPLWNAWLSKQLSIDKVAQRLTAEDFNETTTAIVKACERYSARPLIGRSSLTELIERIHASRAEEHDATYATAAAVWKELKAQAATDK